MNKESLLIIVGIIGILIVGVVLLDAMDVIDLGKGRNRRGPTVVDGIEVVKTWADPRGPIHEIKLEGHYFYTNFGGYLIHKPECCTQ